MKKLAENTTSVLPYVWIRPIRIYSGMRTYNKNRIKKMT